MTIRERPLSGLLASFSFVIVCLSSVGSAAETHCKCRSPGQSYLVGTCVCMDRPGGVQQLACCEMSLNNPSWQFTGKGCPVAKTEPAAPAWMRTFSGDEFGVAPKTAFTQHSAFMPH